MPRVVRSRGRYYGFICNGEFELSAIYAIVALEHPAVVWIVIAAGVVAGLIALAMRHTLLLHTFEVFRYGPYF